MLDMLQQNMDEYLPLRDVVFNTLRQAILTGELKPGERLMEIHLADRLGVSRTPIREAMRKLELEGLVVILHISLISPITGWAGMVTVSKTFSILSVIPFKSPLFKASTMPSMSGCFFKS